MNMTIPNLRHLRVFLEVAERKSITRASESIFLSQPAITQAIAKLEIQLNTQLFERHSDGMYPTEAGAVWQRRVQRSLDHLQQGCLEIAKETPHKTITSGKGLLTLITTTQLRALIAVCDAQNFSIASRNISVSQSSVHRAARELERLLGVILFEKTSLGIASTKAARTLTKATKLAFSEIRQGYYEINSLQFKEVGSIAIGSMPLARTHLLPQTINAFSKTYPDINLTIIEGPYNDLLHHLRQGDIDLLLGALRFPSPAEDIEQTELLSPPLSLIARTGHPLSHFSQITAKDLVDYSWVIPAQGTPTRRCFEDLFNQANQPLPHRITESSSQILIRELLLESDRLALISAHQMHRELSLGLLQVLPLPLEHTRRPIGLSLRKNWLPTPRQSYFIDLLKEVSKSYNAE